MAVHVVLLLQAAHGAHFRRGSMWQCWRQTDMSALHVYGVRMLDLEAATQLTMRDMQCSASYCKHL
jgi:hypothetical protein